MQYRTCRCCSSYPLHWTDRTEAVTVGDVQAISELAGVPAKFGVPLPLGVCTAEPALIARNGIGDFGVLHLAEQSKPRPLEPKPVQRGIDGKASESPRASANIPGSIKAFVSQNPVLKQADAVIAGIEFDETVSNNG